MKAENCVHSVPSIQRMYPSSAVQPPGYDTIESVAAECKKQIKMQIKLEQRTFVAAPPATACYAPALLPEVMVRLHWSPITMPA
jgi:hypothetical protein